MVCSSLPNLSSRTSPSAKSSAAESAIACSAALCRLGSEGAKRRMVSAIVGSEPFGSAMRVARREPPRSADSAVGHIAAEGQASVGEDRALQREAGAHVGTGAVTAGGRAGDERQRALQIMVLLFRGNAGSSNTRRMGRFATERSIHFQSSSSGSVADGTELHHVEQRAQRDVDDHAAAGTQADFSRSAGKKEGAVTLRV